MSAQGFTQTILTPSGEYLTGNTGLLANLSLKDVDPETGDLLGNSYPATSHIGNGQYAFGTIPYACYKLYNDATPVPGFHGDTVKGRWIGSSSFSASIITSGTLAEARLPTGINANKIADGSVTSAEFQYLGGVTSDIQTQLNGKGNLSGANPSGQWEFSGAYPLVDNAIPSPTDPRHVTTKDYVDALDLLALHKAGAETITGAKLWKAASIIDTANGGLLQQSVYLAPPSNLHFTPKKYVDDKYNALISGLTIPEAQQSDRTIRVIYDGVFEGGDNPRVELTINDAIASAVAGTPVVGKQYYIFVEKNGGETGIGSAGNVSSLVDYVHISGQNINTVINGDDTAYAVGGLGRTIVKDCALTWATGATATPSFINVIFENVLFDISDNSIDFTTCMFLNCRVKGTAGNWTLTDCSGTPILADELPSTITGYAPEIIITGLYNQRQLGRKGATVASATTITLGSTGNYFRISGTTDIERITTTGWTEGSEITLYFEDVLNLVNAGSGAGHFALEGASNVVTATGTIVKLILEGSVWYTSTPPCIN